MSIIDSIRGARDRTYVLLNHFIPIQESLDVLMGEQLPPSVVQARALLESQDAGGAIERLDVATQRVQQVAQQVQSIPNEAEQQLEEFYDDEEGDDEGDEEDEE